MSAAASANIDKRIKELGDWRGETLAHVRKLIHDADPEIVEEWKWRGVPVWEHDGIVCTGETYKQVVKLTFARGAALADPKKLFNSSLDGNVRRAIDIPEGAKLNEAAFKTLIRAAVAGEQGSAGRARGEKEETVVLRRTTLSSFDTRSHRPHSRGAPWAHVDAWCDVRLQETLRPPQSEVREGSL